MAKDAMAQGVQQSEVDEGLRAVAAALLEAGDRGIGAFGLEGTTALAIFGTSRPDFGVEPRPLRQFRLQPSLTQKFVHFGTGFAAGCIIFHGSSGCVPR